MKELFDWVEKTAKQVIEETGSHRPQLILDTGEGLEIIALVFENDEDKQKAIFGMRFMVNMRKIERYIVIMEGWLSTNPKGEDGKFRRAKDDPERKSVLSISEFRKDMNNRTVIHVFDIKEKKTIWGERTDIKPNREEIYSSPWNFFVEDATSEVIENSMKKMNGGKKDGTIL